MKNKKFCIIVAAAMMIILLFTVFIFTDDKDLQKEVIKEATEMTQDILKYEMSQEEIQNLSTTEIVEQTEQQENAQEQAVEDEGFELQGQIAYEGDRARSWNVELGDYKALVYYSQLDRKMVQ